MRHDSVYAEAARKRKPSKNIDEALMGLKDGYKAVQVRTRYPAEATDQTRHTTTRMVEGTKEADEAVPAKS